MKLKLIFDTSSIRSGYDDLASPDDDDTGYCSDSYVNSRHEHERTDYHEAAYRRMSKYMSSKRRNSEAVLADISDDIMLQYMLEGVYDWDYIAYDQVNFRICISNNDRKALRYGERTSWRTGRAGNSPSQQDDQRFFQFRLSNTSPVEEREDQREPYEIVPDHEHYRNIHEALQPYVKFQFIKQFKMVADMVMETQRFEKQRHYDIDEPKAMWYEDSSSENMFTAKRAFLPDEKEVRSTWDIGYDAFYFVLMAWKNDTQVYLDCKEHFSEREIEALRLIDARIEATVSGTNQ